MTGTSISSQVTPRARAWLIGFAVVVVLIAIQSVTLTLPIQGRVLDETSGRPVPGAAVAVLWQLDALTPHNVSTHGGGTVRMAEVLAGKDGTFRIPAALIVHPPLLPFSPLTRSDTGMPTLIIGADGYYPESANNDVWGIHGPSHSAGFLFLRTSSLEGQDHRLTPLTARYEGDSSVVRIRILDAEDTCAQRLFCKRNPLRELKKALEHMGLSMR